jgi:cell division protein FtsL
MPPSHATMVVVATEVTCSAKTDFYLLVKVILIMVWILAIALIAVIGFSFYINSRLFAYINKLETKIDNMQEKSDNMYQSLKELVQEDFLLADGRLKKFIYQKDRNNVYNGIKVQDQEVNI